MAHTHAFARLCQRVCRDAGFIRARKSILERFAFLRVDNEQDALDWLLFVWSLPDDAPLRCMLTEETGKLATEYGYDRLQDGDRFMFLMVATGRPALLWNFRDYILSTWEPKIFISGGQSFDDVMRDIERRLRAAWQGIEEARINNKGAERAPLQDIHKKVDWYFDLRIKRKSLWRIVDQGYSESTVLRGVRQAQRLLGIQTRRGRPRKRSIRTAPD